jgi:hypothetical protein
MNVIKYIPVTFFMILRIITMSPYTGEEFKLSLHSLIYANHYVSCLWQWYNIILCENHMKKIISFSSKLIYGKLRFSGVHSNVKIPMHLQLEMESINPLIVIVNTKLKFLLQTRKWKFVIVIVNTYSWL